MNQWCVLNVTAIIKKSCSHLFNNKPFLCTGPCKEEFVSEKNRPFFLPKSQLRVCDAVCDSYRLTVIKK